MIICKIYFGSTHILFIWKRFFEKNPAVPELLGLDADEILMTSLLFLMTSHFQAWACPFQKYVILTRSFFFNFLQKFGFYHFQL